MIFNLRDLVGEKLECYKRKLHKSRQKTVIGN